MGYGKMTLTLTLTLTVTLTLTLTLTLPWSIWRQLALLEEMGTVTW